MNVETLTASGVGGGGWGIERGETREQATVINGSVVGCCNVPAGPLPQVCTHTFPHVEEPVRCCCAGWLPILRGPPVPLPPPRPSSETGRPAQPAEAPALNRAKHKHSSYSCMGEQHWRACGACI